MCDPIHGQRAQSWPTPAIVRSRELSLESTPNIPESAVQFKVTPATTYGTVCTARLIAALGRANSGHCRMPDAPNLPQSTETLSRYIYARGSVGRESIAIARILSIQCARVRWRRHARKCPDSRRNRELPGGQQVGGRSSLQELKLPRFLRHVMLLQTRIVII